MKRVIITQNRILINGFSDKDFKGYAEDQLGSCRDLARVGMAWAVMRLADDMHKDANGDWNKQTSCID